MTITDLANIFTEIYKIYVVDIIEGQVQLESQKGTDL